MTSEPVITCQDTDIDLIDPVIEKQKLPESCTKEDAELLARLELQNRLLEADSKSLNSLTSGHSRKSSSTSLISMTSGTSHDREVGDEDGEDVWQTWGTVVSEWDVYNKKKNSYIKDLVRKGIPHHFRSIAWQLLCSAQICHAREFYTDYLKSSSPCEKVILRDIARTYPEHEFFREKDGPGQESLFNVMKAYSLHDREVGYCQGSAFIVGLLLLQMPEEDAFCVLVQLMEEYRLREMYKPSMAELGLCMYQLECLVQEQIQELHVHFQAQSFHTSMYASSWFLTLFTSCLPLHLACRVMDLFLSEGMEIIFRIAVAILQLCKDDLIQQDMEGMLRYFQKEMPTKCETDPDHLINLAFQVKHSTKKMKRLEKDYVALKAKEQEEMVELRRLRTENKLLRQRIEHLEQESSALADRLVQGQVIRAQEAEDSYAVKRELASLRHQEQSIHQELERAYKKIKELHLLNSQPSSLDNQTESLIHSMQEELVSVKLREAENQGNMQELLHQMQELETANKRLRERIPDSSVAHLQEELIAVKLREAEANLSLKELRQKVSELQALWESHVKDTCTETPASQKDTKISVSHLHDEVMAARLHETEAVAELKELQQKVLELETKNQVSHNQIRRQAEEMHKLEAQLLKTETKAQVLEKQLVAERKKYIDIESKMKEHQMITRLREVEQAEMVLELHQKISYLEMKNQELSTGHLLSGSESDEMKNLKQRLTELQVKVAQQAELNKKLTLAFGNISSDNNNHNSTNISEIPSLLEGLNFSRSNMSSEVSNFEQIYNLQFDPHDLKTSCEKKQLKNKVSGDL